MRQWILVPIPWPISLHRLKSQKGIYSGCMYMDNVRNNYNQKFNYCNIVPCIYRLHTKSTCPSPKGKAITCRNFPNRPTEMSLVAKLLLALALTPSVILALTSPSSSLIQVWIFAFKAGELNTILRTPCPHPNPVYPPYLYKTLAIRMGIMIEENQLALNVYQSRMSRSS